MKTNIESVSIKACYMMLQPIVRILLRLGVSYKTFTTIAQKVYIDSVLDDEENKISASAIAALTGISRKRVGKIIEIDTEALSEPTEKLAVTVVIDNWWDHMGDDGKPVHLPAVADEGLDIKQLVASAKVDLPFSTVLKLIKRSAQIEIDDEGLFFPISRHNSSDPLLSPGSIMDGAATAYSFTDTLYKNIFRGHSNPANILFERRARVPLMSESEFSKFQDYCKEKLPNLIEEFNDWLESSVGDCKITASPNQGLTGIGIYAFDYPEIKI
ncbi:MAG: DUF6502 family protein [Gammaproteobacteria bacterium]